MTQFKAKCLGIVEKVQKEKCRVTISRYGRPAARLEPVMDAETGRLFGRARKNTKIVGDVVSTGEAWNAQD